MKIEIIDISGLKKDEVLNIKTYSLLITKALDDYKKESKNIDHFIIGATNILSLSLGFFVTTFTKDKESIKNIYDAILELSLHYSDDLIEFRNDYFEKNKH